MNIIYLKIAKTGGTSLVKYLEKIYNDKLLFKPLTKKDLNSRGLSGVRIDKNVDRMNNRYPVKIIPGSDWKYNIERYRDKIINQDNSLVFTTIRNPVYRFLSGCNHFNLDPLYTIDNIIKERENKKIFWHISSSMVEQMSVNQTSYFENTDELVPKYFIRLENMTEDLSKLLKFIPGVPSGYLNMLPEKNMDIYKAGSYKLFNPNKILKENPDLSSKIESYFEYDVILYKKSSFLNERFLNKAANRV